MWASLRRRLRAVDEAALGELLAHVVDVEAELAFLQALARAGFLGGASIARFHHVAPLEPRHDADAVVVGDHDISRVHETAGAHDRYVHRAETLLHRTLRVYGLRPHREAHASQVCHIAHTRIDHQA